MGQSKGNILTIFKHRQRVIYVCIGVGNIISFFFSIALHTFYTSLISNYVVALSINKKLSKIELATIAAYNKTFQLHQETPIFDHFIV